LPVLEPSGAGVLAELSEGPEPCELVEPELVEPELVELFDLEPLEDEVELASELESEVVPESSELLFDLPGAFPDFPLDSEESDCLVSLESSDRSLFLSFPLSVWAKAGAAANTIDMHAMKATIALTDKNFFVLNIHHPPG
jgi:hypothetical protein